MTELEILAIFQRVDVEADLLFGGNENPPEAELEIIFDSALDFKTKMAKLQVLRGESVTPKSFDNRLIDGDYLHARALGISLEDEMEQDRR